MFRIFSHPHPQAVGLLADEICLRSTSRQIWQPPVLCRNDPDLDVLYLDLDPLIDPIEDVVNHELQRPLGRAVREHIERRQRHVGLVAGELSEWGVGGVG